MHTRKKPSVVKLPTATPIHNDISPDPSQRAKRRKVRKGTKSCWECKRRKIRCIFASAEDSDCLGCQQRRTACISQDMPEELSPAKAGNRHLGERISKVEDLVKGLIVGNTGMRRAVDVEPQQSIRVNTDTLNSHCNMELLPALGLMDEEHTGDTASPLLLPTPTPTISVCPENLHTTTHRGEEKTAVDHLIEAFPSENDAEILIRESSMTLLYNYLLSTQPHGKLTLETLVAPGLKSRLPDRNSHSVTWAMCMLLFAITLQSPDNDRFSCLAEPKDKIMHRMAKAASTWVTNNAEMQDTLDCLFCIMLEGTYEVNNGKLRRAWAVYRKAATVAQLLGIHRSPLPSLKRINPELDLQPEAMWFRIVYMERYLGILLGLPGCTSQSSVGMIPLSASEPPLGKFERLLTVIASRILERNERAFTPEELDITLEIDKEMLKLAQEMPSNFWRPVNFHELTPGEATAFLETQRLAAQVYYYSLLIQLHIPYMIQLDNDSGDQYSRNTCINAGREILTRFIAHRNFNPSSSCSRPVDFFALLAALALLLGHLDAHNGQQPASFLAHQRLSDRAVLQQALERMDALGHSNNDGASETGAKLVRRLLDIEAEAATGRSYFVTTNNVSDYCSSQDKCDDLRLGIPHLGIIKISSYPISGPATHKETAFKPSQGRALSLTKVRLANEDDWNQVTQSFQYPINMFRPENSTSKMLEHQPNQAMRQDICPVEASNSLWLPMEAASIETDIDDSALQGVDMAFFDNLMKGTGCGNLPDDDTL